MGLICPLTMTYKNVFRAQFTSSWWRSSICTFLYMHLVFKLLTIPKCDAINVWFSQIWWKSEHFCLTLPHNTITSWINYVWLLHVHMYMFQKYQYRAWGHCFKNKTNQGINIMFLVKKKRTIENECLISNIKFLKYRLNFFFGMSCN